MAFGLRAPNGSVGAPTLSFENDTDCGFYRIGANNIGMAIGGAKVWDIAAAGVTLSQNLLFTDATHDIGASGATRPRDFYLSRNAVIGGTLGVTGASSLAALSATTGAFSSNVTVTGNSRLTDGFGCGGASPSADAIAVIAAGSTSRVPLRIPHGSAPSSPVNGDIWTTSAGLYVRISGATVGPLS